MEKRPYFRSLRGKIINRSLLIGLIPVAIIGSVAWFGFQQLTSNAASQLQNSESDLLENVVGANLTAAASRTVHQIDTFLLERISDAVVWASAPVIVDAARQAAVVHESRGLAPLEIDEVEARFSDAKSLNVSPAANEYLIQQVERSQHFGEIFFTDRYGFNAALTNPTSDFVQRDENWWKTAWENGISVGQVEFDDSAGIWSVDISVRIDDLQTGNSLGVMKAVLGVSLIQEVADLQAASIEGGSVVVVNAEGLLLAETSTEHDKSRVMNESVNLRREEANGNYENVFGTDRRGYVLGTEDVVSYGRSAGAEVYGKIVARFQGFNWTAVVRQPNSVALKPVDGLKAIQAELVSAQQQVIYFLGGSVVVVLILAFGMAGGLSRSITNPLNELRDLAEAVSKGDTSRGIEVHADDEIKDVAMAFERMRTSISIILNRLRKSSQ